MSQMNTQTTKGKLIEQVRLHDRHDPHRHESRLSDIILGGQDGLVNVLGVILGVAAATQDARIVIAAGLAATFAESISMARWRIHPSWQNMISITANENANTVTSISRRKWRSKRSATSIAKRDLMGRRLNTLWT